MGLILYAKQSRTQRLAGALAAVVATLIFAGPAQAQESGTVTGTVVAEEGGEPLPGVTIAIEGSGHGTLTDAQGRYRLAGVPAGEHVLTAEYIGRAASRHAVTVEAGASTPLDLRLPVEALRVGEVVVSATREATRRAEIPASVSVLAGEEVRDAKAAHPSEIMGRVPGVWVNVTGGEGHMTAMRQPMTTDAVYLYLEDGVPTRSTGFFNHNALYEVNLPQAGGIEVTKGPATALYGSDAIGGVVNAETRAPAPTFDADVSLEGGSHGFARVLGSASSTWGNDGVRADVNVTRTEGWREGTAYDRQSGTVRWDHFFAGGGTLKTVATFSNIDQNTAGSSRVSSEDFLDRPTVNYTPISFRKVRAFRLSTEYERRSGTSLLTLTPYVRWNEMDLLPNWSLSYDPTVYTSGHKSLGLLAKFRRDFEPLRTRVIAGVDIDWSPGGRTEHMVEPTREASIFTAYETGDRLYDYDVAFQGVSPYVHAEISPTERLRVSAGLRFDHLGYDYENHLGIETEGSHRRPASTRVDYDHLSPKLGATYIFGPGLGAFASYRRGFRAPSESQIFRQGQAENTIGLKPVKANSYEVGVRGALGARFDYELSAYHMTKLDDVLSYTHPDGTQETTNAGETLHRGVELGAGAVLAEPLRVDVSYSYARHTYEDWRPEADVDLSGREIESAPRHIGSARLTYSPTLLNGGEVSLEWSRIGEYWMDAENTHEYAGHDLLNLRIVQPITANVTLFGRVVNLTDERYAESAAFNQFRGEEFAPGLPRTFYLGFQFN